MSGETEGLSSRVEEGTAQTLRVMSWAMGGGIGLLAVAALAVYFRSAVVAPDPRAVRGINALTILSMAVSLAGIVVSEIVWKLFLRGASEADVNARARIAFLSRSVLREGAALVGTATFFLACQDGVLRFHPAYWVDLAPAALFWIYLRVHWPRIETLRSEVAAAAAASR